MKTKLFWMLLSLLLVLTMMVVSCGGDDDDPDPLNVTGNWTIMPIGYPTVTAVFTHAGTIVTATSVTDATNYVVAIDGATVAVAGSTTPRTITLTLTCSDGQVATLVGTVSDDNSSMNGTYTDTFGGSDTWTATRQ